MDKLKRVFFTFSTVNTCVIAGVSIYLYIFNRDVQLNMSIFLQIMLVSFTTSLGIFLYPNRQICKKELIFRVLLHYVYVNLIVLGCGLWFEWYDVNNIFAIIGILTLTFLVFLTVSLISWKKAEQFAELVNQKLKEYQDDKEE